MGDDPLTLFGAASQQDGPKLQQNGYLPALNQLDTHGFTHDQFLELKSFSLSYLSKEHIIGKVMLALPHLINPTHLTLKHCSLPRCTDDIQLGVLPFNARDLEYERVIDGYIDQLFNTFRTPFWLDEHGWFVRCD
ncbi:unnamed protein product [Rotaria sp. Silwood1]|nr:unnamed protein product [Rotaria sp. Silwood1]